MKKRRERERTRKRERERERTRKREQERERERKRKRAHWRKDMQFAIRMHVQLLTQFAQHPAVEKRNSHARPVVENPCSRAAAKTSCCGLI